MGGTGHGSEAADPGYLRQQWWEDVAVEDVVPAHGAVPRNVTQRPHGLGEGEEREREREREGRPEEETRGGD